METMVDWSLEGYHAILGNRVIVGIVVGVIVEVAEFVSNFHHSLVKRFSNRRASCAMTLICWGVGLVPVSSRYATA